MTTRNTVLPEFEKPPVVETVLGVEFAPLPGWDIRHYGLFWGHIRADYPSFQVRAPLTPTDRPVAGTELAESFLLTAIGDAGPQIRAWYIDQDATRLLQLQDDHFILNWRKVTGEEAYPRYKDSIRPAFIENWHRFTAFLQEFGIQIPIVRYWEVTYVNHLMRGIEWNRVSDLSEVIAGWDGKTTYGWLPAPDSLKFQARYPFPEEHGQLSVTAEPVVRRRDNEPVIQLNLKATGTTETSDLEEILARLDYGRELVVRGFEDVTTERMHNLWGKRDR